MSFLQQPKSLDDFRWEKRIVVVFDSSGFDQTWIKNHQKELEERKLLLVHVSEGKILWKNLEEELAEKSFVKLSQNLKSEENWLLIGLDGGIKNQGAGAVPMESLMRQIDSMPMRQSEIRRKNGKEEM
ncbi:DUF4174 domain-containing protein [Algoriphagus algorifonticola]|uniref:DUF4174 domain-containing protein n=1 Tax=Algoriphagus algorifonticola TaxID=2593007 RepID=UPI001642DB31|nr:DUF4174 domain-containing protein [Algoriphagus algorifonticola]